jgi:glycosyltransferase involved in cell wall biosynthesis
VQAVWLLVRERPNWVILQWWSGTVLHSYMVLALVARCLGARVVIEFHEILDTGEARLRLVRAYTRLCVPILARMASGYSAHSEIDRALLASHYGLDVAGIAVVPHGPFDHFASEGCVYRDAPAEACNLLYFGVIREYKGLDDLIAAFEHLCGRDPERYWLTIVGETWENYERPSLALRASPYIDRITFINRFVTEREAAAYFAGADLVVLPYRRSSMSGPLHIAMSVGLPVVVTAVGGLTEAVANYEGAVVSCPEDPRALANAVERASALCGRDFSSQGSWDESVRRYEELFDRVAADSGRSLAGDAA